MESTQRTDDLMRNRVPSAEVAECNCPDGCERDHDTD